MTTDLEAAVARHYGRAGLAEAILEGLEAVGADLDAHRPEDLAPVDEFHTAGRLTTQKALKMIPIEPGMHVLDAGAGLGGTARVLAAEHGCRVTGIDLTPEYVAVARLLTGRMGLDDRCTFHVGSAVAMPFADGVFDAGVSFHAAMNIEDRAAFYGDLARVLRPGAPVCLFDVLKGPTAGMRYPVPWAETEATSFLYAVDDTLATLDEAGLEVTTSESLRDFAIDYFHEVFRKLAAAGGPPPLGLHLLTGANASAKFENYLAALEDDQIEPVILIATRR